MDKCNICGFLTTEAEELHEMSCTHVDGEIAMLEQELKDPYMLNKQDIENINNDIEDWKDEIFDENTGNYMCGRPECDFVDKEIEVVKLHEKRCIFQATLPTACIKINPIDNKKKLKSNAKATCDQCGKVYLHTSTLLPKHALNRHQKTCKGLNMIVVNRWWRDMADIEKLTLYEKLMIKATE